MDGHYRKRRRVLTKRVHPLWYHRYAEILPEDSRTYVQPLKEMKEEKAMLAALKTPPNANAQAEALVKKLMEEKTTRVKVVLKILEGKTENLDIKSLKPIGAQSPLTLLNLGGARKEHLRLRVRAVRPPGYRLGFKSKWRMFWENKIVMQKFKNMVEEYHVSMVHARWRKAIRLVRCCIRFTRAIAIIASTTAEVFKQFRRTKHLKQRSRSTESALVFDKNLFKSGSVGKDLDTESIFTLTKPSTYRTPQAIYQAAVSLKFLKAFSNFPFDLQEKMATIGWYIEVSPDRVLIREGQYAHCFYFIIAGNVAMVKIKRPPHKANTGFEILKTFEMGDIIGIDALTERGMRPYSLCSTVQSKLLSVNVDDYNEICLSSPVPGENPDHIRLLSQIACMRYFPMRKLTDDSLDNVILFYFTADTIITSDAAKSNFLFVVKKGSCRVMAQISWRPKKSTFFVPPSAETARYPEKEVLPERNPSDEVSDANSDQYNSITSLNQCRINSRRKDSGGNGALVDMMERLSRSWTRGTIAQSIERRPDNFTKSDFNLIRAASMEKMVHKDCLKRPASSHKKQWLLVKKLQESDIIGIETLDLGDNLDKTPARIAVISEGAEIILISKEFFLSNATPLLFKDLRSLGYILPDENTLKAEMERQRYWKRYQHRITKEVFGKRRLPAI